MKKQGATFMKKQKRLDGRTKAGRAAKGRANARRAAAFAFKDAFTVQDLDRNPVKPYSVLDAVGVQTGGDGLVVLGKATTAYWKVGIAVLLALASLGLTGCGGSRLTGVSIPTTATAPTLVSELRAAPPRQLSGCVVGVTYHPYPLPEWASAAVSGRGCAFKQWHAHSIAPPGGEEFTVDAITTLYLAEVLSDGMWQITAEAVGPGGVSYFDHVNIAFPAETEGGNAR